MYVGWARELRLDQASATPCLRRHLLALSCWGRILDLVQRLLSRDFQHLDNLLILIFELGYFVFFDFDKLQTWTFT